MQSMLNVDHVELENDVVWIKAEGRLDAATVSSFEQVIQHLLTGGRRRLVIDLHLVTYISSSGLRAMITARRQARAQGGDVVLCCMSPRVRQVLDMMGFSAVFGVFDDAAQAAAAFSSPTRQGRG